MKLTNTKSAPLLLSIITGLLLSLAWPEIGGLAPLTFIAFVPMLMAEDLISGSSIKNKKTAVFFTTFVGFAIWNGLTSWWIYFAAFIGAFMAVLLNSLYMGAVMVSYHAFKKRSEPVPAMIFFVTLFITYEHLHYYWDLTWPWLTLGNVFANMTWMIQWYEITGVFGGSLWILSVNAVIFYCIRLNGMNNILSAANRKRLTILALIIAIPLIYSAARYFTYKESSDPVNIAIVQPNIDPYNEKFNGLSSSQQLNLLLNLARTSIKDNTQYVLMPETALVDYIWENEIEDSDDIKALRIFQKEFPSLNIVTGMSSRRLYYPGDKRSETARRFPVSDKELFYDSYNSALYLSSTGKLEVYHKSKLVPGVENLPFAFIFKYIESFTVDLGGITGSLGIQRERTNFRDERTGHMAAPVICYESVFGEYVSKYIRNGGDMIFILTNDGWWDDTPGYKQHLAYARLRAIETRRSIARSANTGISAFINQRGDISQPQPWWQRSAINGTINANKDLTIYTRLGDYIAYICILICFGLITIYSINRLRKVN